MATFSVVKNLLILLTPLRVEELFYTVSHVRRWRSSWHNLLQKPKPCTWFLYMKNFS